MKAPAIELDTVSKTYVVGSHNPLRRRERQSVRALEDVTLTVEPGEIFGLVGRNGYGKTTLIKCICSLVEPTRGAVRVRGHDTVRQPRAVHREVGYVSADDRSFYFRLSGRKNLEFFARLHGIAPRTASARIAELSERFGVADLLSRRFHEYSTGNRQRLAIVRALLHAPKVLVLDEPTRSLDPFAAAKLRRALVDWVAGEPEHAVLITSHNLGEVEELSDRVGIMTRGRLSACGTLQELRQRFDDRERVRIWCARIPEPEQLVASLSSEGVVARCDADAGRGEYLEFQRQSRDPALDLVLKRLAETGCRILSFDRSELSLQDIVEQTEETSEVAA